MKALSLWQYWASLCIWGEKEYETRSWGTSYRGTLVIHAAKTQKEVEAIRNRNSKMTPSQWEGDLLNRVLKSHGIMSVDQFPYGAALGTVEMVGCWQMTESYISRMTEQERAFGNWQPGRFAWQFIKPQPFDKPIPIRGMQGLFEVTL